MDILTHAICGAVSGAALGSPLLGALAGVAPDIVLGIKRVKEPTELYNATHSFGFVFLVGFLGLIIFDSAVIFYGLLSHLLLDLPTHGNNWKPMLFWPNRKRYGGVYDWEFFNVAWVYGLYVALLWCSFWGLIWIIS